MKVIALEDHGRFLTKNEVYTVLETPRSLEEGAPLYKIITDDGFPNKLYGWRFKILPEDDLEPAMS